MRLPLGLRNHEILAQFWYMSNPFHVKFPRLSRARASSAIINRLVIALRNCASFSHAKRDDKVNWSTAVIGYRCNGRRVIFNNILCIAGNLRRRKIYLFKKTGNCQGLSMNNFFRLCKLKYNTPRKNRVINTTLCNNN